jgi:hypothetical protein
MKVVPPVTSCHSCYSRHVAGTGDVLLVTSVPRAPAVAVRSITIPDTPTMSTIKMLVATATPVSITAPLAFLPGRPRSRSEVVCRSEAVRLANRPRKPARCCATWSAHIVPTLIAVPHSTISRRGTRHFGSPGRRQAPRCHCDAITPRSVRGGAAPDHEEPRSWPRKARSVATTV